MTNTIDLQARLKELGIDPGPVDGVLGVKTIEATCKAIITGQIRPNSDLEFLKTELIKRRPNRARMESIAGHLELDDQNKLKNKTAFADKYLTTVPIPTIDGKKLKLTVNKVMAFPLMLAFAEIQYENLRNPWRAWLPKTVGTWCVRFTSSNPKKRILSTHSWAMALDIDVAQNKVNTDGNIPIWVVELMERWGFIWGGRWPNYKDPMHFQYMAMK